MIDLITCNQLRPIELYFSLSRWTHWIILHFCLLIYKNNTLWNFVQIRPSTSRINRMYLNVLIPQIVVVLISSQEKVSRRYLVDISLMSISFWPHFDVLKLKIKIKRHWKDVYKIFIWQPFPGKLMGLNCLIKASR